jgi:hypothetical protein
MSLLYGPEATEEWLNRHGLADIADWLSKHKRVELEQFFGTSIWHEVENREEVREKVREVKRAYDKARNLLEESPRAYLNTYDHIHPDREPEHPEAVDERWGQKNWPFEEILLIFSWVHDVETNGENRSSGLRAKRPEIFRLVDGRGNPNMKAKLTAREAEQTAKELVEEHGPSAFSTRKGARYPVSLTEMVGDRHDVSGQTAQRYLKRADYDLPEECHL